MSEEMETPKVFLDTDMIARSILHWRSVKERADSPGDRPLDAEWSLMASCYIDAYQCVLHNHGLPKIPNVEEGAR